MAALLLAKFHQSGGYRPATQEAGQLLLNLHSLKILNDRYLLSP